MKKVSQIEMSEADVEAAILMYLNKSGEDLGSEEPAIVLTSSGKGKGCTVTASVTLSSEVVVSMGDAGALTVLPSKEDKAAAFKKPTPKPAKELIQELGVREQDVKTEKALDAADLGRTLKEEPPVEIVVEEEEILVEEEEVVEIVEEVEETITKPVPVTSTASLFATKETVQEVVEEVEEVKRPAAPANASSDNLFG